MSALGMNCGGNNTQIPWSERPDYDTAGVLGVSTHLSNHGYEVDRKDNAVGYCLRNMLRMCFKHNAFKFTLASYGGVAPDELGLCSSCVHQNT
jgi:hypothetical protein